MAAFGKDGHLANGEFRNCKTETRISFVNGAIVRIELVISNEELPGQWFTQQIYPVLKSDLDFTPYETRD